jgi:hypothetical protein
MLPPDTFEMRKYILTLLLAKPKKSAEAILKTYELFIYGNVQYITSPFCKKNLLK